MTALAAAASAVGLAGAATIAILGWLLKRARDRVDMWRATAKRQAADLATARENERALEAACRVLRAEKEDRDAYLESLVEANPGLAGSYVQYQLRRARSAASAESAPTRPPAGVPPGNRRKGTD